MTTLLEERGMESYLVRVIDILIGASFYLIGKTYSLICFYSYSGFLLYFAAFEGVEAIYGYKSTTVAYYSSFTSGSDMNLSYLEDGSSFWAAFDNRKA